MRTCRRWVPLEPRGGGNRFLGPPSPATRFHRSPLRPRCLDCNASSDYGARVSAARGSTHWGYLARCHRRNPLPPDSAEALLGALLGSDPALRPLKHVLIERTKGTRSSWRRASARWSRRGRWLESAAPTASPSRCQASRSRRRSKRSWPLGSTGSRSKRNASSRRRGHRQGCALYGPPGHDLFE
jgi:hypothetical protein